MRRTCDVTLNALLGALGKLFKFRWLFFAVPVRATGSGFSLSYYNERLDPASRMSGLSFSFKLRVTSEHPRDASSTKPMGQGEIMNRRHFLLGTMFSAFFSLFARCRVATAKTDDSGTRISSSPSASDRCIAISIRTTGPDREYGHHIFEIAGISIDSGEIAGQCFHQFLRPPRDDGYQFPSYGAPPWFLRDNISFAQIAPAFVQYLRDAHVVMHNGRLDLEFLDQELRAVGLQPLKSYCASLTDTSTMARELFGAGIRCSSLEVLCARLQLASPTIDAYRSGVAYAAVVAQAHIALTKLSENAVTKRDSAFAADFN